MISRLFILSAIAFSGVAAQAELIAQLLKVPTDIARIALLPDAAFKFDFANDVPARTTGAAGFSSSANSETMPATIGNDISITAGFLGPCGSNTPHTHPRSPEFNFVTNGSLITGMIPENGAQFVFNEVFADQATLFPEGAIHFEYNDRCEPVTFVAFFRDSFPGVNQIAQRYFGLPPDVLSAALGIDQSEVEKIANQVPDNIALALEECTTRCGISRANQPTRQLEKNVAAGPTANSSNTPPNSTLTTTPSNSNNSNTNTTRTNTTNAISNDNGVKGNLDSMDGDHKGLIIGLIVAVGVMGLGYIVLALLALVRRRKGGKGTARGYVRTGESFAPGGVYDSEKYELPSEHLRTPYDPPSGSH